MAYVTEIHGERELNGNVDSTKDTSSAGYMVWETTDEYEAYAAVAAEAPLTDGFLVRDSIKLSHIEIDVWEATVEYIDPSKQNENKDPDIGQIEWDFDTTGGTQHITSSYETKTVYTQAGWNQIWFEKAIEAVKKKHGWEVKGTDVVVPKLEITCTTSFAPNVITLDWIKAVARMTGKTNHAPWKTFDIGEMLFMGARIKAKYREKVAITFTFSASENITAAHGVFIGGQEGGGGAFGPVEKRGHEHMWIYFINQEDANRVLMKPVQCNIEQIYFSADFSLLGLGN